MERAQVRTQTRLNFQRGFERSRLEGQLVAAAFELAVPFRVQSLPNRRPHREDVPGKERPLTAIGGLSA